MKIGYIGLGLMGMPCARNILNGGHELFIWSRSPEKIQELVSKGATLCKNAANVAENVEILFTNVTATEDVEAILLGPNGVREGAKPGLIVVDMSTISALATRQMAHDLAKENITLVDAPVSGGTVGATNASLTFMVGASEGTFTRIEPILKLMGTTVTRIGEVGSGQVAKSCNQIIITGTIATVAEAFKFAKSLGVDLAKVRQALLGGFAASKVLELHGQRMLSSDYTPGFKTSLHLKDMSIVGDIAMENDLTMPITTVGLDLLSAAVEHGFSNMDSAVLYKIVEEI